MAKQNVKCPICGQIFDRNAEPYVMVAARRYAHKTCVERLDQEQIDLAAKEERDLKMLFDYIEKIFKGNYDKVKTEKQIKSYHKEYSYSYSGMFKALYYWFDIKGNTTEESNDGVGILPYIYYEAYQYFYNLYAAQQRNTNKNIEQYKPKVKEITISPPTTHKKHRRLFFEGEETEV